LPFKKSVGVPVCSFTSATTGGVAVARAGISPAASAPEYSASAATEAGIIFSTSRLCMVLRYTSFLIERAFAVGACNALEFE
jgi:hypothetical protein